MRLPPELDNTYKALLDYIRPLERLAVGYSGGVDSTLVLRAATDALGRDNALGVMIHSELVSDEERQVARRVADEQKYQTITVPFSALGIENVAANPPERCYACKRGVFQTIIDTAKEHGIENVADGNTHEDLNDPHRPGMQAAHELGVISPLMDLKMEKPQIRELCRALGLSNWDKPTEACLASRIPYGTRLTTDRLSQVEAAEKILKEQNFEQVRVRHFGDTARIEVAPEDIERLTHEPTPRAVEAALNKLGYTTIEIDPDGYRTGSMNENLKKD